MQKCASDRFNLQPATGDVGHYEYALAQYRSCDVSENRQGSRSGSYIGCHQGGAFTANVVLVSPA
jgi:hypothetical protein